MAFFLIKEGRPRYSPSDSVAEGHHGVLQGRAQLFTEGPEHLGCYLGRDEDPGTHTTAQARPHTLTWGKAPQAQDIEVCRAFCLDGEEHGAAGWKMPAATHSLPGFKMATHSLPGFKTATEGGPEMGTCPLVPWSCRTGTRGVCLCVGAAAWFRGRGVFSLHLPNRPSSGVGMHPRTERRRASLGPTPGPYRAIGAVPPPPANQEEIVVVHTRGVTIGGNSKAKQEQVAYFIIQNKEPGRGSLGGPDLGSSLRKAKQELGTILSVSSSVALLGQVEERTDSKVRFYRRSAAPSPRSQRGTKPRVLAGGSWGLLRPGGGTWWDSPRAGGVCPGQADLRTVICEMGSQQHGAPVGARDRGSHTGHAQ